MASSVAEIADAFASLIYELPPEGETDELLTMVARQDLRQYVIERLKQLEAAERPQTPVYCLVLSYDAVADDGVSLRLGEFAQREAWAQETDEYNYRSLIFHSYMTDQVFIHISPLSDVYERWLRTYRRDHRWQDIRQLINQVARDLNDQDWGGIFDTTDDFIVFASDYEAMEDVHDEIRNCVPANKEQLLIAKGLLS